MNDEKFMAQAIKLARLGIGNTSPNPMVGAVVVSREGEVVGVGHHERAGADHAEVVALRQAGVRARDATLYVTLEPCTHQGRTPPCVETIKTAGIVRVVSALEDPDPRVRGAGHAQLRSSGIEVTTGIQSQAAAALNRMYLRHRETGRPFVTLKMAQSLNGVIAAQPGERRQLSGKRASKLVRSLRYEHDAVMVGVGTVLVDDPALTVRPFKSRAMPYVRVVVDARGRIPSKARVLKDQMRSATIVATTPLMPQTVRESLLQRGIKVLECARTDDERIDLGDLLEKLGKQDILSVLCEGGPTIAASLLARKLVDELVWLVAPLMLSGEQAVPAIHNSALNVGLQIVGLKKLGDDLLVRARVSG
jgi:diaminohydroxyphosphoribosylaminopyrimidine deaminase / 5-amino-6-(5-phosphoribosylamino)uracil reductase